MPRTTIPFSATDQTEWIKQLHKELQNQTDLLVFNDAIEGFEIDLTKEVVPYGIPPKKNSEWKQFFHLEVEDEKKANQLLLSALMEGATGLLLSSKREFCNWAMVLDQIQVAYIDCWIYLKDDTELKQFDEVDLISKKGEIEFLFKKETLANYFSAFDLQQIGAKMSTQLSALLLSIHRDLEANDLKNKYFFELGVGTLYFPEIAKLRAFRNLISRLEAIHHVQINYELIVKTGFSNKSLQDPYTNLLRQATEALSAVIGGCDALCIEAYDTLSVEGPDDFSRRMALNIGNLIQEEVQLKRVQDPLKNSSVVEALTNAIIEHSWTDLIKLDERVNDSDFHKEIEQTRQKRKSEFQSGAHLLIGVNHYENVFETKVKSWANVPEAFGFPYLIYELE